MPIAEDGDLILKIYEHFRSDVGDVLGANNFVAVAGRELIPMRRVREGLEYAANMHWIEQVPNGFRLTRKGHDALDRRI